jgi:tetratricopeptide (TPR) repeat protein
MTTSLSTRIFTLGILLVFIHFRVASQPKIDSLKRVLAESGSDTNKVNTLNQLSWNLRSNSPDQAMRYAIEAGNLARKLDYEKGEADSYNYTGVIKYRQGNLSEALNDHFRALQIREKTGDQKGTAMSLINIGNIYSDQGSNKKALEYFTKAARILEQQNDISRLAVVQLNIGAVYLAEGNYELAEENCKTALEKAKTSGNREVEAFALNNLGLIYQQSGNLDKALESYKESYALGETIGDKTVMVDASINIGNIYRDKRDYQQAITWHRKAETMSGEIGYMEGLRSVYECLSDDCRNMKNFAGAYEYYVRFKQVSDSLYNEEKLQQMMEMQMKYEVEKKELAIEKLEKEMRARSAFGLGFGGSQKSSTIWITALVLVACGFIGYLVYAQQRISSLKYQADALREIISRTQQQSKNKSFYNEFK